MTPVDATELFRWVGSLLLTYPVLAVLAVPLVHRFGRTGVAGTAAVPALTFVGGLFLLPTAIAGVPTDFRLDWLPGLSLTLDLRWDALGAVLALVVSGIGTLVVLYSARYFPPGDPALARYIATLLGFTGAMLGLVLADNLILLVVCWELTGILSYLLIGLRTDKLSARRAAAQAFIVTTAGGLVMLVGAVLLGAASGSYRISTILADPPTGTAVTIAVVLLLVGGLSKSAIVPFQFWLPGAMAAPTPASAYLHAATMVKAGVYLFARLAPVFAALSSWQWVLVPLGAATMIYGAAVALRQTDLKLLLAYGTVSQLGLITLLIGVGTAETLLAALAVAIAHATFKAALFFVVGIIDTGAGTRDLRELNGLGRTKPVLSGLALLAGLSMAGIPPMLGFAAKESGFTALLHAGAGWATAAVIAMTIGSVLTVAYTARFLWGAFGITPGVSTTPDFRVPLLMGVPTGVLVVLGLLTGVIPQVLEPLVAAFARTAGPVPEHTLLLWHGVEPALGLSAAAWLLGAGVFIGLRRRERDRPLRPSAEPGAAYRAITGGVSSFAGRLTEATQRGSLPVSLGSILAVLLLFPGLLLILSGIGPGELTGLFDSPLELALCLVVAGLAVITLRSRRGLVAVLLVGGVGYLVALLFVARGAPDLALTQLLVETITLVAAILVLRRLPDTVLHQAHRGNRSRLALAVAVGALMAALAMIVPGTRIQAPVSDLMFGPAQDFGGGANLVNVILVDIRGWDTLGEILVLVAASTGVASLIFLSRRTGRVPRAPSDRSRASGVQRPSPWLVTNWSQRPSLLLEVVTRLIFHTIVLFSVYVLFVGHDAPGGGFAGGLIVGLALTLRYLAGGGYELGESAPWDIGRILGLGVLLAVLTALGGLVFGGAALQSVILEADVPLLGHLKFVTSSFFDIGVYFVVIGLVLDVLRSFGAGLDQRSELAATRAGVRS